MAELVVVGFDNPNDADRVLTELTRLHKEYLIEELKAFKGHVIRSSLSPEQESRLQEALSRAHPPRPSEGGAAASSMATTSS